MQTPSESTDTKLDTSNEPSAHLIEENVALPEEIFHSYFSYLLYEMAHCKPVMITFLLNTCLVLLFLFFHDSPSTILFYIYSLLIFVPMLGAFIKRSRAPIQNQDFEAELLVEVIKRKPAVRGKEWRTITYNMNQYLLGHGLWNTPYYFYGDEQCYVYFLSLIAGVTPKKQTTASIDDIADAQSNVPTTVTPGEDIEPASPSSAPNYRNFLLKAAEIEQQAQNNYWKERDPEITTDLTCSREKHILASVKISSVLNITIDYTRYKLGMQISLESTDTKLDTSNEPSAYLIEENVALPKDIFRSYLSYWIYEAAHCTPVMFLSLVIGVLISIIILFHDNKNCVGVSVGFLVIFFIIFGCVLGGIFGIPICDRDFKIKLLGETIARRPAGREWRTVAYNMNQYLFDEGLWYTPYYFYCGRKCQYFFNNLVKIEGPNTHPSSPTNDEENTQPDASEIEVLNVVGRFFIHSPDPILEAYLIKAAEINREAEFEYWRKQYPEVDLP
ncbi:AMM_1a_G0000900.mRNA.1.CDS.1 [Saccharomyces cerevisiae]|nr:AMM_1a_G0000900.mRNA.1.CDS.1 [Saccharomyces cerevisiae]CAI6474107.1 AMM_1a_G0000900.mRNA.1.CDS.1 [Saccharomyces cerevisiae]